MLVHVDIKTFAFKVLVVEVDYCSAQQITGSDYAQQH